MKRITLLSAVTLLFAMNCLAQDKGYVGVSLGPGIPVGDFGSTDQNSSGAGYAKTGAIFEIAYAQKFGKYLGIAATIRGAANMIDAETMTKQFENSSPGANVTISKEYWQMSSFMAGGYGSFPMTPKVSFEAKLMGGLMSVTSPELSLTVSGPGGSGWVRQEKATAAGFGYSIGGGFKFNVGKKVCLLTSLDLVSTKANFKAVRLTSSAGENSSNDISQTINTVNIGFGVGYRL